MINRCQKYENGDYMKKIHIIVLVITLVLICLTVFSSLKINCSKISCDDIKQLNDLLGIELDSLIIKDISCKTSKNDQYPSTIIDIDIKSNTHELFDYFDTTSQLPPGLISYLEEKGIDINKINYTGVRYEELKVPKLSPFSEEYRPYEIWLISIGNSNNNNSSEILSMISNIPYEIKVDIDSIVNDIP